MRIIDLLNQSVVKAPEAVVFEGSKGRISYQQMLVGVDKIAQELRQVGCGPGVRVAIVLNNSIEYLISFFAISATGGTVLPLSGAMTSHEISKYLSLADVTIVITNSRLRRKLSVYEKQNCWTAIVEIQHRHDTIILFNVDYRKQPHIDTDNIDVALMVPTSGSTGPVKIVMLTHENLVSNMCDYRNVMAFNHPNVVYCALGMHHIYSICAQLLTHISLGDTFVINEGPFLVREFLKTVDAYQITCTALVPSMASFMADFSNTEEFDLSSLRYITLSGAKTPVGLYRYLRHKYPHIHFVNMYGMSEAGSRIALAPVGQSCPMESVGPAISGVVVRIIDAYGAVVPAGKVGQIIVQSTGVMKGYYREPELTANTVIDGWLHTGDMGYLDDVGNLFIVGRLKENILSGGQNIDPFEIEECILEHPGVLQVATVAKPDRVLQEVPCSFVVKRPGFQKIDSVEIIKFCQRKLSSYKIPNTVNFLERLPYLSSGKIDRKRLQSMASNPE